MAAPKRELIVVAENRLVVGSLQGGASAPCVNQFIVVFADEHRAAIGDIGQSLPRRIREGRDPVGLAQDAGRIGAGHVVGRVAVRDGLIELPVIEHALQRPGIGQFQSAIQRHEIQRVDVGLRSGEHQRAVHRKFLHRRRTLAVHRVVRAGVAQIESRRVRVRAQHGVEVAHPIVGEPAPAVPVQRPAGNVEAESARVHPVLRGHRALPVRAAG